MVCVKQKLKNIGDLPSLFFSNHKISREEKYVTI